MVKFISVRGARRALIGDNREPISVPFGRVLDLKGPVFFEFTYEKELKVVAGATYLFSEAEVLEVVNSLAEKWFQK
jgi:hypothetical protein